MRQIKEQYTDRYETYSYRYKNIGHIFHQHKRSLSFKRNCITTIYKYLLLSFTSHEFDQTSIYQTCVSVLDLFAFDVKLLVINESGDFLIISPHKVVYEDCLLSSILLSREKKLPINHVTSGNCNVELTIREATCDRFGRSDNVNRAMVYKSSALDIIGESSLYLHFATLLKVN